MLATIAATGTSRHGDRCLTSRACTRPMDRRPSRRWAAPRARV